MAFICVYDDPAERLVERKEEAKKMIIAFLMEKKALKFTKRLQASVCLFRNRLQMASKFDRNKEAAHKPLNMSMMFLLQFVICDLTDPQQQRIYMYLVYTLKKGKMLTKLF